MNQLIDYLPQATAPIILVIGLTAAALMGSVLVALHADSLDMAEAADLARLSAALPPLDGGRHSLGWATGTDAQRILWSDDTCEIDVRELWTLLRADQVVSA